MDLDRLMDGSATRKCQRVIGRIEGLAWSEIDRRDEGGRPEAVYVDVISGQEDGAFYRRLRRRRASG